MTLRIGSWQPRGETRRRRKARRWSQDDEAAARGGRVVAQRNGVTARHIPTAKAAASHSSSAVSATFKLSSTRLRELAQGTQVTRSKGVRNDILISPM
ncbi:unnamed protein product [Urochloa humidicola]